MRAFVGYVGGLYLALALAVTWPLATRLDDALPLGSNRSATVPLVSAWALWWSADRAQHGFTGYWDAPIFHPTKDTFAFSEPMPLLGIASTPLFALGASPALAHNLALLLALWLNGMVGYALCRELRLARAASAFGGALILLLPYVHHQLGVLALVPLFGIEAALLLVLRVAQRPSFARGAAVGLAVAVSIASCLQHTLMFGAALVLAFPFLVRRRLLGVRGIGAVLAALLVALAITAPELLAHRRALSAQHFERTVERGEHGSAGVRTWFRTPYRDALPLPGIRAAHPPGKRSLFPGAARVLFAIAGIAFGSSLGRRRRTRFLIALTAASVVLSVVGNVKLGAFSLYEISREAIPGLSAIRSVWRAGVIAQIAVMLLAAQGLHALLFARYPRWLQRVDSTRARTAAAVLCGTLALFELWPPEQRLADVPQRRELLGLAQALEAHAQPGEPLLLLPVARDRTEQAFAFTARFMYATAVLGHPWVNGYSSYSPRAHKQLRAKLAGEGDQPQVTTLRSSGAALIVLVRAAAPSLRLPVGYRRVFGDGALELWAAEPRTARLWGSVLQRQFVALSPPLERPTNRTCNSGDGFLWRFWACLCSRAAGMTTLPTAIARSKKAIITLKT